MKATIANFLSHSFVHRPVGGYEFRIWKENIQKLTLITDSSECYLQLSNCSTHAWREKLFKEKMAKPRLEPTDTSLCHCYHTCKHSISFYPIGSISAPLKKHIMTTKLLLTPNGFLEAIQRHQWHNLYIFITCKFFIGQMLSIELFKFIIALA